MTIKECYEIIGGNYDEVMDRLRKEERVLKFLGKFLQDKSLELLENSIADKNYDEAFRAAHTIKGISQNLSFDRLYESSHELTELFRDGKYDEAVAISYKTIKDYKDTADAISKLVS